MDAYRDSGRPRASFKWVPTGIAADHACESFQWVPTGTAADQVSHSGKFFSKREGRVCRVIISQISIVQSWRAVYRWIIFAIRVCRAIILLFNCVFFAFVPVAVTGPENFIETFSRYDKTNIAHQPLNIRNTYIICTK
jgi:hypothetical protein